MALININGNPSARELRQFAAIFPVFWMVVAGFVYRADSPVLAGALAVMGLLVGVIGLSRPAFIHPIYLGWIYATYPIGWTVSHLMLAVMFYLIVTPAGIVMRLCGYDPMQRRLRGSETTYWVRCEPAESKTQYFRQF